MSETPQKQRMVAIVGRPNVGKSALFNRLAKGRFAIVHFEPGVTRDRLMREAQWRDQRYTLVDTGGVSNVDGETQPDAIEAGMHRQVEAALADASVALLVVDVDAGRVPLDESVARWLRVSGCQTFVVANKADNPERDTGAVDFAKLGFPVFPVSALHDRGFHALMEAVVAALPAGENETVRDPLRVAIVGHPNVGKSSYINRLLGNDRVIVSAVAGTTRDSIDIPFAVGSGPQARHYSLIDTAGLRRAGKITTAVERFSRMRTEDSIARCHVAVLVLDSVEGPTSMDKTIASTILERRRGIVLLVNKWDLAPSTQREYEAALREEMPFLAYCPIVFASAQTGYNIRRSIDIIDLVAGHVRMKLPTGVLNRALIEASEKIQSPSIRGKPLKVYYATQTGTDPIRVRLFANQPVGVPKAYEDYLVRSLREKFGLEGAPLLLQFKARRKEGEPRHKHEGANPMRDPSRLLKAKSHRQREDETTASPSSREHAPGRGSRKSKSRDPR